MEARKVIGLVAGPTEKDDTPQILVKAVLAGAREEGVKTDLRDLRTPAINYPEGCHTGSIPAEILPPSDFAEILDRITNADGIVIGSSASGIAIPAGLERTLDEITDALHGRMLTGKFGCSICTSEGDGSLRVVDYMNGCLERLGITMVGGVGAVIGKGQSVPAKDLAEARELGRILARSIVKDLADPGDEPDEKDRETFYQRVKSEQDRLTGEFDSFIQNGWTNGP